MKDSLFVKIFITVIIGIICLSAALGGMNIFMSKEVFVDNYSASQEKVFLQIDKEMYQFFSDITQIAERADTSWAVREYLTEKDQTIKEEMKTIYHMKKHMKSVKVDEHNELGVMIFGSNDKSYIMKNSIQEVSSEEIMHSKAAVKAMKYPGKLVCEYEKHGYTDDQKDKPVLVMARTLDFSGGMIFFTVSEEEFKKIYGHFTSDISDMMILNQDRQVVSSNNISYLKDNKKINKIIQHINVESGKMERIKEEHPFEVKIHFAKKIYGTGFTVLGVIDPNMAFMQQYRLANKIILTLAITSLVGIIIFVLIRQQTRPLSRLAEKMRLVQEGNMEEYVQVEGPREIQELTKTYNTMLEKINAYIDEKMKIQDEKRKAEIYALQMQINPHYMYNTLASIKWLMWQGDVKKSTAVIDAFISLLRNTISNTDEFVTVEQEVRNLENYVLINKARYGEAVDVEFFVGEQCKQCFIQKLILQPFVENAFFHAFPEGMTGKIYIFIKKEKEHLRIEISDDGIGMDEETLDGLKNKTNRKSEHFTGIGINNVDDRIRLVYGEDYGIHITSKKNVGTTVTILLPDRGNKYGNTI